MVYRNIGVGNCSIIDIPTVKICRPFFQLLFNDSFYRLYNDYAVFILPSSLFLWWRIEGVELATAPVPEYFPYAIHPGGVANGMEKKKIVAT
jgi:hypothetical protein